MKTTFLAVLIGTVILLSNCTTQVRVPAPGYHARTCGRLWIPGHYSARGYWIVGHWRY